MDGLILDIEADIHHGTLRSPTVRAAHHGHEGMGGLILDQKFSDNPLHVYQATCCISGLRVEDATMVDALAI
ncbi:MAG: hypothetical protein IPM82_28280 [Saprospiraceae bacterium]|nr:hypothetical protein [Saprospiraceae bacterium]